VEKPAAQKPAAEKPATPPVTPAGPPEAAAERIKISPLARRLAAEKGIPIETIKGTGPGGRIIQKDIEAAPGEEIELSPLAKVLAERVTKSKQQAPHFYVTVEADMGEAIKMRTSLNAVDPEAPKITFNDIVVKAVALALRKHSEMNATFAGDKIIRYKRIDVGMAVALEDGLIVAVVRNAAEKGLATISAEARGLIERARAKRLKPEEYTGSTFTVSNAGMYNVENFAAILNPPEAGILAVSSIRKVPAVVDDKIVIAERMKMTVSADHRVVHGVQVAMFLNEVKRILENPLNLVL
jgi:pyruvate dehydrogenase E2 component (dihydrolipoamide acetyltransferase)